ncbi:glycoside hydrolase family 127 protein [Draconibacterium sp. IB214405]|uniref:glycoside hydrolase family 127 protein n=1 Tax=Draconibacterium sp. IB214405 TaxID=3097352 RepID=UPI002A101ABA|nr:glycoside hydrolase family 127 protein [Draconibacterium sp. IB214405]MDX8337755.1 glycoside hydrolase family 127 protein [Draconibacterium sp. IB214405]
MRLTFPVAIISLFFIVSCSSQPKETKSEHAEYPINGVSFSDVQVNDIFWLPKIETNRKATIPASFQKCEETGRLENFLIAGGKMEGTVRGDMPFDDTDVYKIIEGAAYSMTTIPDPKLDAYVDSLIEIISIGQEEDGYLTTWKTIDPTHSPAEWCPPGERWEGLAWSHELYNAGHMYEAAAAHYHATGKTNFLDIATKNADLLVSVFGADKNPQVPGHQIIETGLIKLYQITDKKEYLDLAKHFLDFRGDSTKRELYGAYNQDHVPVVEQDEAVGHAVRAAYMYAGMTDIAALYKDAAYENAVDKLWDNVVNKKIYITGGIGSKHDGEAFGENYELPNLTAYNETCAAIANVYWNYRMFLLHGDSKYIDVLERSLYNGVISGVALDGTNFFYPNPLSCDMHYHFNSGGSLTREPWFDCSCCPSNMCRFMPSVPGYIYAQKDNDIYVNLFVQSSTSVKMAGSEVKINQETKYPWDGKVKISVSLETASQFAVRVRIPGWAQNQPLPGDLYRYENVAAQKPEILVNGESVSYETEQGYAVLDREWNSGDDVELSLPMPVRTVKASELVEADKGKVAIERGPIVYCVEEKDNPEIESIKVSEATQFESNYDADLLAGVEVITASGKTKAETFTAIPYYVWNNRGANKMDVWLSKID